MLSNQSNRSVNVIWVDRPSDDICRRQTPSANLVTPLQHRQHRRHRQY